MATTLAHSSQGGGRFSTHVHASTGWKDWASTPVLVSTGWRVRWVLLHCSQPPPRYQSRGYGSAAKAAPGPQRTYRRRCTRCIVAALALLPHYSQPPPRYHRGAMGVLQQPHSSCTARTAAAAAHVSRRFWHCIRTAAEPAPLPIKGPRGCCNSHTLSAAHVLQLPQPVPCCTGGTAAPNQPTPAVLPTEGPRGGGAEGGGVGGGGTSAQDGGYYSPPLCTLAQDGGCALYCCARQLRGTDLYSCACQHKVRGRGPFPCAHQRCAEGKHAQGGGGGGNTG